MIRSLVKALCAGWRRQCASPRREQRSGLPGTDMIGAAPPIPWRQWIARASIVAALVMLALSVSSPVAACSCAPAPRAELAADADVVFVGKTVGRDDPNVGTAIISSHDPIRWTFVVERVAKGAVAASAVVTSSRSGVSCGREFALGARYLVYASYSPWRVGDLHTGLCAGGVRVGSPVWALKYLPDWTDWGAVARTTATVLLGGALVGLARRRRTHRAAARA